MRLYSLVSEYARMKHRSTRELYRYWSRLKGDRLAPERSEIEPSDIRKVLADAFILEANEPHVFTYRLAGTRLCSTFRRELKGRHFLELFTNRDIERVAALLNAVTTDGAVAFLGFTGQDERERKIAFETIMLPLAHNGKMNTRVLGSTSPLSTPYWLGVTPIMTLELTSVRLVWPSEMIKVMDEADEPEETAPPVAAFLKRHGHLVVYEGGRQ